MDSKELYELMKQFEKDCDMAPGYIPNKFDREVKELNKIGQYYANGAVNQLFYFYMMGYSNAKHLFQ